MFRQLVKVAALLGRTNGSIVLSMQFNKGNPHDFLVSIPGGNDIIGYLPYSLVNLLNPL